MSRELRLPGSEPVSEAPKSKVDEEQEELLSPNPSLEAESIHGHGHSDET